MIKKVSYLAQKEYEKQSGHNEDFLDSLGPLKKGEEGEGKDIKNNNYHVYLKK